MSHERTETKGLLDKSEGLGRRDFIRKMAAVCGLPAAAALLGGCGGGILDSDYRPTNGGSGDLQTSLLRFRGLLAQWLENIRLAGGRDNVNVPGLLAVMNPEFAAVWALMIVASAAELRSHVPSDMQPVLDSIDPSYDGPAREVTEQQLLGARERADEMIDRNNLTDDDRGVWVFLVMAFLLFPALAGATAMGWAQGAWARDTDNQALLAWFWLNSSSPHPWSAGLIGEMSALFFALALYLYLSMGTSYLAQAPGLMFGRHWLVLLMLLLVLLVASWTGGSS